MVLPQAGAIDHGVISYFPEWSSLVMPCSRMGHLLCILLMYTELQYTLRHLRVFLLGSIMT